MPKRWNNLLIDIANIDNIYEADRKAQIGKDNIGITNHNKHKDEDNYNLSESLMNNTYQTSEYDIFKIYEPKERDIYRLPFYPDRIAHHAIMNIMEKKWVSIFTKDTYACIKGRGILGLAKQLEKDLRKDPEGTVYCLKIDIKKFYASIDHDKLKEIIRKKIKDDAFLKILDGIIDSADGVPIGNYLSQFFANLFLAYFDHIVKEVWKIKYYYRYCDDMAFLASNKEFLWDCFYKIKEYLNIELKLELKPNYQIFPIEARGLDFVGYIFYHSHTLLRQSIKRKILKLTTLCKKKKLSKERYSIIMGAYWGWLNHCNSRHLVKQIYNKLGWLPSFMNYERNTKNN